MNIICGSIIIIFSFIAWVGQVISAYSYNNAQALGLAEKESDVDPVFLADMKGEAIWDSLILWILPVAGILLILDHPSWIYFGLVGGGSHLYFAGRGIIVRMMMQRKGIRIGNSATIKTAYIFLSIWGLISLISIFLVIYK